MGVKRIRKSEELTNAKALAILRELASTTQLTEEQRKTLDYLEKVAVRTPEEAENIVKQLVEKFGFTRITAIQMANLRIDNIDELRTVLSYLEKREYSESELKEILKVLTGQ